MNIISVQDLINALEKVQNKDAEVLVYVDEEPSSITMVDDSFGGVRVDINIDYEVETTTKRGER